MQSIVHKQFGDPGEVLQLTAARERPGLSAGMALVQVLLAPVHPGDLLGVLASPAYGAPSPIGSSGRTPGVEGVGVVVAIGESDAPASQVAVGSRVAFFPTKGAWSEYVIVPLTSLVPLPDEIPDSVGAHFLVNTIAALTVLRAGHNSLPEDRMSDVMVVQTAAASAVGRILGHVLAGVGVKSIRLVKRTESAKALTASNSAHPPAIATEDPDWKDKVRGIPGSNSMLVALDGVGGALLADIAGLLEPGGAIISYGSLGGSAADIRGLVPRELTLRGVTLFSWLQEPEETRRADVSAALKLAKDRPELFTVAATYGAKDIKRAVAHAVQPGKQGAVLLSFQPD